MHTASMVLKSPTPRAAVKARASTMEGKDRIMSVSAMMMRSTLPPHQPERLPMATPITAAMMTMERPTVMEMRAP